jgi:hypothetical protein
MKLHFTLIIVLLSGFAAFGQIVYTRPFGPCSEQLMKASIQGIFIGDSKEQVSTDLRNVLWMTDPTDGSTIGITSRGLDENTTQLEVRLFKNKVYQITASYSAKLNWDNNVEMANAIAKAWSIPESFSNDRINCNERIVTVANVRNLTLTDREAETALARNTQQAEDAKKKKFKP